MKIDTLEDMKKAAERIIHELGAHYVVIKGGSLNGEATDVFLWQELWVSYIRCTKNRYETYTRDRLYVFCSHHV